MAFLEKRGTKLKCETNSNIMIDCFKVDQNYHGVCNNIFKKHVYCVIENV